MTNNVPFLLILLAFSGVGYFISYFAAKHPELGKRAQRISAGISFPLGVLAVFAAFFLAVNTWGDVRDFFTSSVLLSCVGMFLVWIFLMFFSFFVREVMGLGREQGLMALVYLSLFVFAVWFYRTDHRLQGQEEGLQQFHHVRLVVADEAANCIRDTKDSTIIRCSAE